MNNFKVVIIENNLNDLRTLESIFNSVNELNVYKKFDNLAAFDNFMNHNTVSIDFLVVNIFMPSNGPIETLRIIKKYRKYIKKVICEGVFFSEEILNCLNSYDISYFIHKPIKISVLCYTKPENPINAIARIPAVINAIGTPLNAFGTSDSSNCSRIPAKRVIARPKPSALATA